jgi:tetratricopeptide (TPR) repeat protein
MSISFVVLAVMTGWVTAAAQDMVAPAAAADRDRELASRIAALRAQGPSESLARALNESGVLAFRAARDGDAVKLLGESIAMWEQVGAADHPGRVTAVVNLARVHAATGRFAEAERTLTAMRALLELKPPDVRYATVLNNLGLVVEARGDGKQAERLFRRAIELFERAGPAMDGQRGSALNNLASRLLFQGRLDAAREAARQSAALQARANGEADPDYAVALHTLAMIDHVSGGAEEAAAGYRRALSICRQALGESHPGVAMIETSLASLQMEQGYYGKAEPLFMKALATRERMLGPEDRQTAVTLAGLGTLRARQERYTEAERLLARALRIMESGGAEAHYKLSVLGNLAGVETAEARRDKRKYKAAETHLRRLLELHEQLDGVGDIRLTPVLDRIADVCVAQGRTAEAARVAGRALAIRRVELGERHPETAANLRRYTSLLNKL